MIPFAWQPPPDALLYVGNWDPVLVALSVLVAVFASYAAVLVAEHVVDCPRPAFVRLWRVVGGLCLGAGIWAMHFVGMLAFTLPCATSYDPTVTALSMLPGILASILAMAAISRRAMPVKAILAAGLLLGAGIGTMHFSGMAALRLAGIVRYDPALFALSIVVAVILSVAALWVHSALSEARGRWRAWATPASAAVMGLAVSGMHYTAMASAYFIRDAEGAATGQVVTPTLLASVVLVVTCAITIVTLVGNFLASPAVAPAASHYRGVAVIIVAWTGMAWLSVNYYIQAASEEAYRHGVGMATQRAQAVAGNIDYEVGIMRGVATLGAKDEELRSVLRRMRTESPGSPADAEGRRHRWSAEPALAGASRTLAVIAGSLGADVVYLLDAAGDCIAASNAAEPASFVGSSFADRDYYQQARLGRAGLQYAFGRVSKLPGLYLSQPVEEGGAFLGAVVVKREVTGFLRWIAQASAFISDRYGVIIVADDDRLRGRALPGSTVQHLSEALVERSYGQKRFPAAEFAPWRNDALPGVVQIGGTGAPTVLVGNDLLGGTISIHVSQPVAELDKLESERRWLFLLLAAAGDMLIVAVAAVLMYLRSTRQAKDLFERQAVALARSSAELERFTKVLAHHIQEPIRLQRLFAQTLAKSLPEQLSDRARNSLAYVRSNAERLHNLFADVQRYLALDRAACADGPCDAGAALAAALAKVGGEMSMVGARVESDPLPRVMMGEAALTDVLYMLLENSVTYRHPERPLAVRVSAAVTDGRAVLCVSDNGIGIAPEFRDQVFHVFERLHSAHDAGTGIGLALVKKAVEAAGGKVWIEDGDDGGTRICLGLDAAP
ncbi:MAG: MHYT domain-containing protein [Actinomycetota bacterium]